MTYAAITFGTLIVTLVAGWLVQVRTPRRVTWEGGYLNGIPAMMADGLVLQHDDGRTVWASRGYAIYRSFEGAAFERVARVRPPFGEAWGGYVRWLRTRFGYQELLELMPLDDERLVVFAGGRIMRVTLAGGRSRSTHSLRYFGRGKGRGLMAFGLCRDLEGAIYYAEYVTESGAHPIGIWKSVDEGDTWQLAYEFPSGMTRHIHAVFCDPQDGAIWIGSGDRDEHCFVGRSTDGAATFEWVGRGAQDYRTCAFVSFDDVVAWGMDADFVPNHVIRWHRNGNRVTSDAPLPDATYYARRIDADSAMLGVAQGVAQIWIARADGSAEQWLDWSVPAGPSLRGPSPGVRLARGASTDTAPVHVNPLRTSQHEAAIFRIDREHVPSSEVLS